MALVFGLQPLRDDDEETKRELCARLTAAYKLDYFSQKSIHFQGAADLYRRAVEKKWTREELFKRLDEMTEETPFPTWAPADFFKKERMQVYPKSWLSKQIEKDPQSVNRIQFYKLEGIMCCRYTPDDGSILPAPFALISSSFGDHYSIPERGTAKKEEEIKPKTMADWLKESERLRMQLEIKASRLEKEVLRLTNELIKAQDTIYRLTEMEGAVDAESDFSQDE